MAIANHRGDRRGTASLLATNCVGLLLAVLCIASGFLVVGMGHGWDLPVKYGVVSLLVYPVAMVRWHWTSPLASRSHELTATAIVAVLTVVLVAFVDGLPPPPRSATVKWLILPGSPIIFLLTGITFGRSGYQAAFGDIVLLAIGVAPDLTAYDDSRAETMVSTALWQPWLVFWLGWQAIAALALVRHLRRAKP